MPLYASVYMCLVVTCWERADLLAFVCGFLLWVCYFPIGILGQVWYLIASIPDLCTLSYFEQNWNILMIYHESKIWTCGYALSEQYFCQYMLSPGKFSPPAVYLFSCLILSEKVLQDYRFDGKWKIVVPKLPCWQKLMPPSLYWIRAWVSSFLRRLSWHAVAILDAFAFVNILHYHVSTVVSRWKAGVRFLGIDRGVCNETVNPRDGCFKAMIDSFSGILFRFHNFIKLLKRSCF